MHEVNPKWIPFASHVKTRLNPIPRPPDKTHAGPDWPCCVGRCKSRRQIIIMAAQSKPLCVSAASIGGTTGILSLLGPLNQFIISWNQIMTGSAYIMHPTPLLSKIIMPALMPWMPGINWRTNRLLISLISNSTTINTYNNSIIL